MILYGRICLPLARRSRSQKPGPTDYILKPGFWSPSFWARKINLSQNSFTLNFHFYKQPYLRHAHCYCSRLDPQFLHTKMNVAFVEDGCPHIQKSILLDRSDDLSNNSFLDKVKKYNTNKNSSILFVLKEK